MGLYSKYILPKVVHCACTTRPIMRQREKVVPLASGQVLEIGIGSGLNLPFYDATRVTKLWGLDPAPEMTCQAMSAVQAASFEVALLGLPADAIPLDDNSMDTIVMTYTLCSIPDPQAALRQMTRVLRPGGVLIFCEHGVAPDPGVRRWQQRINPIWKRVGGGCHLDRDIPALIAEGGFTFAALTARYIPGWRPASFNYWGTATRA